MRDLTYYWCCGLVWQYDLVRRGLVQQTGSWQRGWQQAENTVQTTYSFSTGVGGVYFALEVEQAT